MSDSTKINPTIYFTGISITIGLISLAINVIQYYENKEMRANQAELTKLQLIKTKNELLAKESEASANKTV